MKFFLYFSLLIVNFHQEIDLLISFPNVFSFHSLNRNCKSSIKIHLCKLEDITLQALSNLLTVVVVSDTSIKNHVTTSIAYVHIHSSLVIKTIHHIVNIMLTKAKLFVIECGINQASHLLNTKRIVIISDFIHMAKFFFDSSVHLYQIYLAAILYKLRKLIVDKETKKFDLILILLCKYFWDFSRKNKCDNILNVLKIHFQASDDKGQHSLKLCDDNIQPITLSIAKGKL